MFAVQTKSKSKGVAEGKQHGGAASPREQTSEVNPVWQSLALRPFGVQTKLTISQPNDPYEQEADRVADHVMRMATPLRSSFSSTTSLEAQRKCAGCEAEEEQIQRKEESGAAEPAPVAPAIVDEGLSSPGRPLDTSTRTFMETRFGHDFSQVKVHENSRAATSATAINAKAYTLGSHIVFAAGQYQPESNQGRRLLAHELAHTVQQGGTAARVQRDTEDFRVTQVQPDPVERTKGIAPRFFFEIERSDFREDVPAEKAERDRLIEWAGEHKGEKTRVTGRASQEGSRVSNTQLARERANTVAKILRDHEVKVDEKDIRVDMSYAKHPVDYRFYRSVELGDPTCNKSAAQKTKDLTDCETAFTAAHGRATAIANAAMARIRADEDPEAKTTPPPGVTRDAVLARHFPGVDRATLLPLFEAVVKRLGEVAAAAGHTCMDQCVEEEVCERPASAGADTPLRLCAAFYIPEFHAGLTTEARVFVVMHETTHSAVVPGSDPAESVGIDIGYSKTRLFGVLTGTEALRNADSYVMTLLMLAGSAGNAPSVLASRQAAPADKFQLTTPTGETGDRNVKARRAIGFAESWLNYSAFWAPKAYELVANSLSSWKTDPEDIAGQVMLEIWAPTFQLHHPGAAALSEPEIDAFQTDVATRGFPTPPISSHSTIEDRTKIAGIYDRYKRMLKSLSSALTVDRAASGDGSWSTGTGLPGLGTNVELPDTFFTTMTPDEQTRHIIRLMARAMSDVGATWVEAYVEAADGVHRYRGLGP